jgi:hypothetical protein
MLLQKLLLFLFFMWLLFNELFINIKILICYLLRDLISLDLLYYLLLHISHEEWRGRLIHSLIASHIIATILLRHHISSSRRVLPIFIIIIIRKGVINPDSHLFQLFPCSPWPIIETVLLFALLSGVHNVVWRLQQLVLQVFLLLLYVLNSIRLLSAKALKVV